MAFRDLEFIAELFDGGSHYDDQVEELYQRAEHVRPAQERERCLLDRHHKIRVALAWREANRERWRLTQKAHRIANRERLNELARARYAERADELREQRRPKLEAKRLKERERRQSAGYLANKAEIEARNKAWRAANPEKVREARRRWELANPSKAKAMRRAGRERRRAFGCPPPIPESPSTSRDGS